MPSQNDVSYCTQIKIVCRYGVLYACGQLSYSTSDLIGNSCAFLPNNHSIQGDRPDQHCAVPRLNWKTSAITSNVFSPISKVPCGAETVYFRKHLYPASNCSPHKCKKSKQKRNVARAILAAAFRPCVVIVALAVSPGIPGTSGFSRHSRKVLT